MTPRGPGHPVPRRGRRPRRQGRQLREPRATRATRSSSPREYYDAGRGRDHLPRRDGDGRGARRTMYEMVAAHGGAGVHPAHGRRRRALASTTSTRCCESGADKIGVNSRRDRPSRAARRDRRPLRRPGARAVARRASAARAPTERLRGDDPRRPHRDRRSTPSTWAREAIERGAGELLVNSIDADGTKEGFDLELDRGDARARAACR